MKIEKLLGSKTKTDILKYLIFKRQGISIRALENELEWSFPAIKKQVDSLLEAEIINIDKDNSKWSIFINEDIHELIKRIFLQSIEFGLQKSFASYDSFLEKYYLGKIFGNNMEVDMVVIYKSIGKDHINKIKEEISEIFKNFFIDDVGVVFMSSEDFQRRYRLADKFVLGLLKDTRNISI